MATPAALPSHSYFVSQKRITDFAHGLNFLVPIRNHNRRHRLVQPFHLLNPSHLRDRCVLQQVNRSDFFFLAHDVLQDLLRFPRNEVHQQLVFNHGVDLRQYGVRVWPNWCDRQAAPMLLVTQPFLGSDHVPAKGLRVSPPHPETPGTGSAFDSLLHRPATDSSSRLPFSELSHQLRIDVHRLQACDHSQTLRAPVASESGPSPGTSTYCGPIPDRSWHRFSK